MFFQHRHSFGLVVITSILIALFLEALPHHFLPSVLKPNYALLACLYWMSYRYFHLKIAHLWLIGITLDVLQGVPFGLNSILLILTNLFMKNYEFQFRALSLVRQLMVVLLLVSIYNFIYYFALYLIHDVSLSPLLFCKALPAMLLWFVCSNLLGSDGEFI